MAISSKQKFKFSDLKIDFKYAGKEYKDMDFSKLKIFDGMYYHEMNRLDFARYFGRFVNETKRPHFYFTESFDNELVVDANLITFKLGDKVLSMDEVAKLSIKMGEKLDAKSKIKNLFNRSKSNVQDEDTIYEDESEELEPVGKSDLEEVDSKEKTSKKPERKLKMRAKLDNDEKQPSTRKFSAKKSAVKREKPQLVDRRVVPHGSLDDENTSDFALYEGLTLVDGPDSRNETYSMITPAKIADENDSKITVSVLKVKNFRVVGPEKFSDDNYIKVKLLRNSKTLLVKISDLRVPVADNSGKYQKLDDDISTYEDFSMIVKVDGVEYETEPLTAEQVSKRYESIKTYEESRRNAPTDDTYIKTADGKFVKETEVFQPISYRNAQDDEVPTHYIFKLGSGEKTKNVIVTKKFFDSFDGATVRIDGNLLPKLSATPVVRCRIEEAKFVQTSTDGKDFNTIAFTTGTVSGSKWVSDPADIKAKKDACFELYKKGNYKLEDAFLGDDLTPTKLNTTKRYEYTDEHIMVDKTAKKGCYKSTDFKPLEYAYNGKKIKLKSGPTHNVKKGIKNSYKGLFEAFKYSMAGMISPIGLAAVVIASPLLIAYFGAMVAAVPLIPVVHLAIKAVQRIKTVFKDKVKFNRRKNYVAEKSFVLNNKVQQLVKKAQKKGLLADERECAFMTALNDFERLEQDFRINGTAHYDSSFIIKDGVGKVDEGNAIFAGKFVRETNKKIRQRKRLEIAHKRYEKMEAKGKTPSLLLKRGEASYKELDKEVKARTTNYIAENPDYKQSRNYEKQAEALRIVKHLTLMQIDPGHYGIYDEKTINVLRSLDIDMKSIALNKRDSKAFGKIALVHPNIVRELVAQASSASLEVEYEAKSNVVPETVAEESSENEQQFEEVETTEELAETAENTLEV